MKISPRILLMLALSAGACSKTMRGPVGGKVERGSPLPAAFPFEKLPGLVATGRIAATDLNADGHQDLLWHKRNAIPEIYWNDGAGGFDRRSIQSHLGRCSKAGAADFDGDGAVDLYAVHDGEFRIALQDDSAAFMPCEAVAIGAGRVDRMTVDDWDDRPGTEILWSTALPEGIWCASRSSGTWVTTQLLGHGDWGIGAMTVADVGGDGRRDLVFLDSHLILRRDEKGALRLTELDDPYRRILAAGDLHSTAGSELIVDDDSLGYSILGWLGDDWAMIGSFPRYGFLDSAMVVDLNQDSRDDLVVQQTGFYDLGCYDSQAGWLSESTLQFLISKGDGWTLHEQPPIKASIASCLLVAPLDGNASADLIMAHPARASLQLVRDAMTLMTGVRSRP